MTENTAPETAPSTPSAADVPPRAEPSNANSLLVSGAGVAIMGIAGAAIGVACPLCVVAAPALIGAGVFKKAREWKRAGSKT